MGYGKKSNFRGGTPNLSIKLQRSTVGTVMFHLGQGVERYLVKIHLQTGKLAQKNTHKAYYLWTDFNYERIFRCMRGDSENVLQVSSKFEEYETDQW